jgi:hypothetical protein
MKPALLFRAKTRSRSSLQLQASRDASGVRVHLVARGRAAIAAIIMIVTALIVSQVFR